jgi:2-phosphoglycolate phosphatase
MNARLARAVLFDLDGTLVDTAPDLAVAANAIRSQHGLAAMPTEVLRSAASRGSRAMLGLALPHLDAAAREACVAPFLDAYARAIAVASRLFPGMEAVLVALEADGAAWGVVTNKPYHLARALLDALDLSGRCSILVGGDTLPQRKPEPQPLWLACDHLGIGADHAIYVGDDARDIEAARAAGLRSVAAAWGYRDVSECIEQWGADAIAVQPSDLLVRGLLRRHDV